MHNHRLVPPPARLDQLVRRFVASSVADDDLVGWLALSPQRGEASRQLLRTRTGRNADAETHASTSVRSVIAPRRLFTESVRFATRRSQSSSISTRNTVVAQRYSKRGERFISSDKPC